MKLKRILNDKKGGYIQNAIFGIGALVVITIIMFVVVDTLLSANMLGTENSTRNQTAYGLAGNFSIGISEIAGKLPTILLILAVVFLIGALVLLMRNSSFIGEEGSL